VCGGAGFDDENEDGKHTCGWCHGAGIEPEEVSVEDLRYLAENYSVKEARSEVVQLACTYLDRHDPETRVYIRECIKAVREE
jgi:hypothetical protein